MESDLDSDSMEGEFNGDIDSEKKEKETKIENKKDCRNEGIGRKHAKRTVIDQEDLTVNLFTSIQYLLDNTAVLGV